MFLVLSFIVWMRDTYAKRFIAAVKINSWWLPQIFGIHFASNVIQTTKILH